MSCDVINKAKTDQQQYTYDLNVNGCATGSHSFNSLNDYCDGLEDNSLNNGCAQNERGNLFTAKCPGVFSPARIQILLNQKLILNL